MYTATVSLPLLGKACARPLNRHLKRSFGCGINMTIFLRMEAVSSTHFQNISERAIRHWWRRPLEGLPPLEGKICSKSRGSQLSLIPGSSESGSGSVSCAWCLGRSGV